MKGDKILYVVHCIDTEGPLDEDLSATFARLRELFCIDLPPSLENLRLIQNQLLDLDGKEQQVANCFSPTLMKYNRSWREIDKMLSTTMGKDFRLQHPDDFGGGWVYSWHCMDHVGFSENPRRKDIGFGNIFRFYKSKIFESKSEADELNWHFHPLSLYRNPTHAATSYTNSFDILTQILARRIIDEKWFPVVNRPGFHSERPDSHAFLEQWIPFDYASQSGAESSDQPDAVYGRFGDWSRAPTSWRGYHPDHDDYQIPGRCRRKIFRCLNVGTRFRTLTRNHIHEAFSEAAEKQTAILAFANHDYRDIAPDVVEVMQSLKSIRNEYPDVKLKYAGAEAAAVATLEDPNEEMLQLSVRLDKNRVFVEVVSGEVFGPQPFLAIKSRESRYFHDNLDVIDPGKVWTYLLDQQTIQIDQVSKLGVGGAGRYGGFSVSVLDCFV